MKYLPLTVLLLMLSGCQSSSIMSAGGYDFVHFNDPKCIGSSASGVIMGATKTKEVIESSVSHKTGYCESITGQAISTAGKVYGQKLVGDGLAKSGDSTGGTTVQQTNEKPPTPSLPAPVSPPN